jgi:hypothetical protein
MDTEPIEATLVPDGGVNAQTLDGLSSYIFKVIQEYGNARTEITRELEACKRQAHNKYSAEELAVIAKTGGCSDFQPLTKQKINAATAWLSDIYSQAGEQCWTLEPTPEPDLPEESVEQITQLAMEHYYEMQSDGLVLSEVDVYQFARDMRQELINLTDAEARRKTDRMRRKMEDQLEEGGFWNQFERIIKDFCTYPAAFMRAVERMERRIRVAGGNLEEKDEIILQWERVSPFNVFPSPHAQSIDDGSLLEKVRFSRAELDSLKNSPGYNEEKISEALGLYGRSGRLTDNISSDHSELHSQFSQNSTIYAGDTTEGIIEGYEFWGNVPGRMLLEWGMESTLDDTAEYAIHAIIIDKIVIFAEINSNPLNSKFYYSASYDADIDSIWGESLPEKLRSPQKGINSTRRAMSNNLAISSGPQVMIDSSSIDPSCDPTKVFPWKVWAYDGSKARGSGQPVGFYQPSANLEQILPVLARFDNEADEYSGVPRYIQGSAEGARSGAARTATGLSMLMNASQRTFKKAVINLDRGILEEVLKDLYYRNMQDPQVSDDCKGDMRIVTRGVLGMSMKEQMQIRRQEFLQLVLSSQTLQKIIKEDGLIKLLREVIKTLDMPAGSLVPNDSTLERLHDEASQSEKSSFLAQAIQGAMTSGVIDQTQAQQMLMLATGQAPAMPWGGTAPQIHGASE